MIYYFAYGSNMNFKHFQTHCPNAQFYKKARLTGYRARFGAIRSNLEKGSFLTLESNAFCYTNGYIYTLNSLSDLEALQKKEGVANGYYHIKFIQINDILAFTYIMNDPVWNIKPSQRYCKLCTEFFAENCKETDMYF